MYIYIYGYTSSSRSLFITKRVAESWEREKERKQVWNIFASLHTFSLSVYYLQLCTRCTRFIRLYEKVFGTDEGSALGKIFRSRHHVARFPDLENHVQSTRPFGRVLVPQHPITLNSKLILWQLCSFQMRKIIMRIFTKNYRHITNNQFKIFSFFCNLFCILLPGLFALNLRATAPNFGTTTVSLATVQSRFRENNCPLSSMLFNSCRDTLRPNFRAPTT